MTLSFMTLWHGIMSLLSYHGVFQKIIRNSSINSLKNEEIKLNILVELLQGHVFGQRFLEDFLSSKNRLHLANRWKSVIIFSNELIHLGQLGWFEANTILLRLSIDSIMLISFDLATRDAKIEKALKWISAYHWIWTQKG